MLITNASAQVAIQTLRASETALSRVQSRISTGLEVQKADDNPAFFLVSVTQKSDVAVLEGTRENLQVALGAVNAAQAAQGEVDTALLNIKRAIVSLETGTAEQELSRVIEEQIDIVSDVLSDTSFNGVNLLAERNIENFVVGYNRTGGDIQLENLSVEGAGLLVRPEPVSPTIIPIPGSVLNLNSTVINGAPGLLDNSDVPNTVPGVNVSLPGDFVTQRTFAISFETGSDITTEQIIYEEGGGFRGLNISIRNGVLVFGGYNLPTDGGRTPWAYREVTASIEANTRYTAQLVLNGTTSATGEFRAYVNGQFVDAATGVGALSNHGNAIGLGQIGGNAVVNGGVQTDDPTPGTGNRFQGSIDKLFAYNQVFTAGAFDQLNTYLAEDWLDDEGIQYYVGSPERIAGATLIELLEALVPVDQPGFSTTVALQVLDEAQNKANRAFAQLGFYEDRLIRQQTYLDGLTDSIDEGIAALIEADLAEESSRLQAFQVQTELARDSLAISTQRPRTLLQLFN